MQKEEGASDQSMHSSLLLPLQQLHSYTKRIRVMRKGLKYPPKVTSDLLRRAPKRATCRKAACPGIVPASRPVCTRLQSFSIEFGGQVEIQVRMYCLDWRNRSSPAALADLSTNAFSTQERINVVTLVRYLKTFCSDLLTQIQLLCS